MKNKFYHKGQSLIGIVIVLVIVGLITSGLYFYLSKQIPEVTEITEKLAEEETVKPEEEVIPPPEEEGIPSEEKVEEKPAEIPKEVAPEIPSPRGRLFGKNVSSKSLVDSDSIFMLGVTDNVGNVDWQTILTISTIAKVSPILIIENKESVDDFSPKLFVEQYSPSKIYLHNYNYNFPNTEKINAENINLQLYSLSNFVVISNGNDYTTGLTAASFAAHFNIPVFFSPLNSNDKDLIKKWGAEKIGIGLNEDVDHSLTIAKAVDILRKNSDYLILTTSDDLNTLKRPRFSLVAPILVGGRNAVVLNITNPTRESVKRRINEVTRDGFSPSYMVVVGSEKNFPFLEFDIVPPGTYFNQDDDHQYFVNLYYWADYNSSNEYIPDAAVGAMTGYSVSDVSSLIARSIFYNRIAKSNKVVYWAPYGEPVSGASKINPILDSDFSKKYINNFKNYSSLDSKSTVINELKNSSVLIYSGHAWRNVLGNMSTEEVPTFVNPTFVFAFGCATLEPWNPGTLEDKQDKPIISYEMIQKGAVGVLGAAEIWFVSGKIYYGSSQRMITENALNMQIGDSKFLADRMNDAYYLYINSPLGKNHYYKSYIYLLGDPKLKIKTSSMMRSNIFSDRIQINLKDRISEKMMCYTYGGCALCKTANQECQQMSQEEPDKVVEFNYPLFLDSYVDSTDISSLSGIYYPRMSLRFFTLNPIRDISIKADGRGIGKPHNTFLGQHCFSFNNQNYCPNLVNLLEDYASINPKTGEESIPQYLDILFTR